MEFKNLSSKINEGIFILTIERPKALNALNRQTLMEIEEALTSAFNDENVKVIVINGSGNKAFVAGADIAEMKNMTPIEAVEFSKLGQKVFRYIEIAKKPVIAAINGYALGGGLELAMACDIRIASKNAKFGQPEVGLGIIPGFAGTQRLPRLVGISKAKELIFTGDMINADEAYRIGLISKIVEETDLMNEVFELAKKIISKGPYAVGIAKECINRGTETDIETAMEYETKAFGLCFATKDQKEGMVAFLEKRAPKF
ncbi:MAG: short-chain-enoyl-CoA hydratase [Thermoanaerobacteraceae bacterium]